jgi:hypothetical protein
VLTDTAPVTVARWTFLGLLAFMGLNLVKSRAAPDVLRRVGQLWDVLTFLPRRFHPLAVRPYGERAVPELTQLLIDRPAPLGDGELIVTAHSQGSVLVVAALAPYQAVRDLRLMTMGSPLRTLHAYVFPYYFNDALFTGVCSALGAGHWLNAFRLTDHVGRSVFVDDKSLPRRPDEIPIPDPSVAGQPVAGHSHYWSEAQVMLIVRQWETATAGSDA